TAGRVRQHDPVVTRLRVSEVVLQHVVQRRVIADLERDLTTVGEATHPLAETIRRLVGGDLDGVPLLFGTGNVGGLTDQVKSLRSAAVSALEPSPKPRVTSHFRGPPLTMCCVDVPGMADPPRPWDPGRALPPVISRRRLNPTYEGGGSCSVWKAKLIGMCRISGSGSRIGRASTNLTDHNRWPSSSMSFSLWSNNVVSSAAIC